MNPFEKIFNYGIISRLEATGICMITAHERGWLKAMLQHPAAPDALTPETLSKLQQLLDGEMAIGIEGIMVEKARSMERQVYHSHLRPLRRIIGSRNGMALSYAIRSGKLYTGQEGFPYKLEYSMVKREWYIIWYHFKNRMMMSTKLDKITGISELPLEDDQSERLSVQIQARLNKRRISAAVQVMPEYNRELSRILYAFSCFEKDVDYDPDADCYTITLSFSNNDSEYVLSKIRFLGKRVKIVDGGMLQRRMYESATKALERYGMA
ncbi:WYL domain-containing protein [Paenibacillus oenotherae]|uniref:WYL domain-containing protein n=1 Tax=Paenibacillus oenotherae TaxID=1435645 RepID=A0ABS7D459_9BACL|nr:WYL domain-containing protein [Paenibacillus oenotherae]MBW7474654.1 WYL domain-containing protein [Paenibacillus oenotherae]